MELYRGGGQDTKLANSYGTDFANFSNFKGNDKNDAMRLTTSTYNTVKKQYMQLQHELPGIVIDFEPMPNPQTSGKKREGFFNYQQQLDAWRDNALTQINDARERNTVEVVGDAVEAVNYNTDKKAAMNAAVTVATGEAVMANDDANAADINANVDREGAATRKAVHNEGAKTRRTVRAEGQATRAAVHAEGAKTRNTVRLEGAKTRNTVREVGVDIENTIHDENTKTREAARQVGQETQEINELSNNVSDILNTEYHTGETKKQVGDMRDSIVSSNLSHEEKKELLNDLARFSNQVVLSDAELAKKRAEIAERIAAGVQVEKEIPEYELPPLKEFPVYENPYPNMGGGTSSSKEPSTAPAKKPKQNPFIHNESKPIDRENKGVPTSTKSDTPPAPQENRGVPYAPEPSKPDVLEPMFKKKHKN